MKNLIVVPYHDWRKINREGFRTRDAHFIESFLAHEGLEKQVIINRPYTRLELIARGDKEKIDGEIVYQYGGGRLIKVDDKLFVVDFKIPPSFGLFFKKRAWFFDAYSNKNFVNFTKKCFEFLELKSFSVISFNIFASGFCSNFKAFPLLFDAWDNFYLFPNLKGIKNKILNAYEDYSSIANAWSTNSLEIKEYFQKMIKEKKIYYIPNGAELSKIQTIKDEEDPFKDLKKPIIGFGGKITHLVNTEIVNQISKELPNASIIFCGPVLDKKSFKRIIKRDNVHFTGDLPYDRYLKYMHNFDVGIIPYHVGEKSHMANSIKAYEYLAAGLKVIATPGNGMKELSDKIYLASNSEEFLKYVHPSYPPKEIDKSFFHEISWLKKADEMITLLG